MDNKKDYINLKWGTLKAWRITSPKGKELLKKYFELGVSMSGMTQHNTHEQKQILFELIDEVPGDIYLDWDGIYVTKEEAKKYIANYGINQKPLDK